jgi:transcriptional regulator with XRE-family HTH domain
MHHIKFSIDTLADDLKYMRRMSGMTQREVAERLGVIRQTVTNYENGERIPETRILLAMVNLYGYDIYFEN